MVPFLVAGRRDRARTAAVAAVVTALAIGVVALAGFGTHAFDAFGLISSNQDRTSRFSLPYKTAQLLSALLPGSRRDYSDAVRTVYALAFAAVFFVLLVRTWRERIGAIDAAAWATLAILLASAWLVPWYILWLLPLAALSSDRRLWIATLALTAWMLAIAVPL